jgi:CheY-like chemotaxis protein
MSIKILLADDSITIQKVVGIIFGGEEYSLTVVDNGKAAVDKAFELNPDVLLIDALMPGMSGYEVCEAVRSTPALANKPILLLTGSFEPFDEDKAKSCGADDFLAKPFESQQIVTKVKELIEQSLSRSTAPAVVPEAYVQPVVPESEETVAAPIAFEETTVADDIWGAFTEPETITAPAAVEEPAPVAVEPASDGTGTQWIPVEEATFAFEEETPVELSTPAAEENTFGDVEFETVSGEIEAEETVPFTPVPLPVPEIELEPEEVVFAEPATPVVVPTVTAAPVETVTEDQLRAAIAGASREVIERIVWEVVPDLAEVMIRDAIEKIKRGI